MTPSAFDLDARLSDMIGMESCPEQSAYCGI